MSIRFLRSSSLDLLDKIFPDIERTTSHRIVNYLSFYCSHTGKHLYYSPSLRPRSYLSPLFAQQQPESQQNTTHIEAKALLGVFFNNHIMDQSATMRLFSDLRYLLSTDKEDIASQFLRGRTAVRQGRIVAKSKELPTKQRKNVYVWQGGPIPEGNELERRITMNQFYQVPHLNKILVFEGGSKRPLLTPSVLQFCTKHSLKIQLLQKYRVSSLVEGLYSNTKSNILMHECVDNDLQMYNLTTPQHKLRKEKGKIVNPVNYRMMPRQVVLMAQRLPKESLARPGQEEQVLNVMRRLLGREQSENLVDNSSIMSTNTLQTNYVEDDDGKMTRRGEQSFYIQRLVTEQYLKFMERPQYQTPFTKQ